MSNSLTNNEKDKPIRKRNPKASQRDILRVAMSEFAKNGLSGARIEEIAAKTKTSKRMIYYYFTDKEGLYARALEMAYDKVRQGEGKLDLDGLAPEAALAKLIGFTFDHHRKNPDFIRMVMIENIHDAEYLKKSQVIRELNAAAIGNLTDIIQRGESEGAFRSNLDPIELHWQISAFSFFNVSNKPTFSALFGKALYSSAGQDKMRDQMVEMILSFATKNEDNQ